MLSQSQKEYGRCLSLKDSSFPIWPSLMGAMTLMNMSPPSTPKRPSSKRLTLQSANYCLTPSETPPCNGIRVYPQASITSYQELVKKIVHQFIASCHKKMSTTSLSNIR